MGMVKVRPIWRERTSESKFIASVWTCRVSEVTERTVLADSCISIILAKDRDDAEVQLIGPKIEPSRELLVPGRTWTAIRLQTGVVLRGFSTEAHINSSLALSTDVSGRFEFESRHWQFPDFEHAEQLVEHMHAKGCLSYDPSSQVCPPRGMSSRSYSRLIKHTTGLSPYKLHQLQRVYQALQMLKSGVPATTVAADLGFTDQAHLTRAVKQFLGHTPKASRDLPQTPE